jgi:predicted nucleic acid-binding protein
MGRYRVVLDACVLVPASLCDTLLRLAETPPLYRPIWSDRILGEVERALIDNIGLSAQKAKRRIHVMTEFFDEACVEGYEDLIADMPSVDPDDRHVMAAAVRSGAQTIVTANLRHFPPEILKKFDVEIQSPDEFLVHQFHLAPRDVADRLRRQAAEIDLTLDRVVDSLRKSQVNDFCDLVLAELNVE